MIQDSTQWSLSEYFRISNKISLKLVKVKPWPLQALCYHLNLCWLPHHLPWYSFPLPPTIIVDIKKTVKFIRWIRCQIDVNVILAELWLTIRNCEYKKWQWKLHSRGQRVIVVNRTESNWLPPWFASKKGYILGMMRELMFLNMSTFRALNIFYIAFIWIAGCL